MRSPVRRIEKGVFTDIINTHQLRLLRQVVDGTITLSRVAGYPDFLMVSGMRKAFIQRDTVQPMISLSLFQISADGTLSATEKALALVAQDDAESKARMDARFVGVRA